MNSAVGKLIVVEGLDGSGKATQTANITNWLNQSGQQALAVTFPDYKSDSSAPIRMYLAGDIGGVNDVNAYAASSFYAVDRYISYQNSWKKAYMSGHTIVADRYTTSNAAHQMSKLPPEEWNSFLRWMEDYEFGRLELPLPDIVLYLEMNPNVSQKLLQSRYKGEDKRDIHEKDIDYLNNCHKAAGYAANRLNWKYIHCDDGENPLSIDHIFEKIKRVLNDLHGGNYFGS